VLDGEDQVHCDGHLEILLSHLCMKGSVEQFLKHFIAEMNHDEKGEGEEGLRAADLERVAERERARQQARPLGAPGTLALDGGGGSGTLMAGATSDRRSAEGASNFRYVHRGSWGGVCKGLDSGEVG
jgi:hypothetical protein